MGLTRLLTALLIVICVATAGSALAAAPANDTCEGAIKLECNKEITGDIAEATSKPGVRLHPDKEALPEVYYELTIPEGGRIVIIKIQSGKGAKIKKPVAHLYATGVVNPCGGLGLHAGSWSKTLQGAPTGEVPAELPE